MRCSQAAPDQGHKLLTKNQNIMENLRKKYMDNNGALCPYCDSNHLSSGHMDFTSSNRAFQEITCNNCDEEWVDFYTLTGVEFD